MKRVLTVNARFAPRAFGGAPVVAEAIASRIAAAEGWRVDVLSSSSHGTAPAPFFFRAGLAGGGEHWTLNTGWPRSNVRSFEDPLMTAEIARLLDELRPDAAHVHCLNDLGIGVAEELTRRGIPFVVTIHDYWWLCERIFMITDKGAFCGQHVIDKRICARCVEQPDGVLARMARARAGLERAHAITYPSASVRDRYEANGAPAAKGIVLPNGVARPGPGYSELRAAKRSDRMRFGYIGGPGPIKGWPIIEKAIAGLDPERAEFVLVDAASHLQFSWWSHYEFGKLAPLVTVVPGYTAATADEFFAGLDALLFLSAWPETFGLTTREAALRGVHVVATDCGAPVEPLTDGQNATILPFGAGPGDLRPALERLIEDGPPSPGPEAVAKLEAEIIGFDAQAAAILRLLEEITAT